MDPRAPNDLTGSWRDSCRRPEDMAPRQGDCDPFSRDGSGALIRTASTDRSLRTWFLPRRRQRQHLEAVVVLAAQHPHAQTSIGLSGRSVCGRQWPALSLASRPCGRGQRPQMLHSTAPVSARSYIAIYEDCWILAARWGTVCDGLED